MECFEYKLVATATNTAKNDSLPKTDDAFAWALLDGMNALGRDGWEFLRTETVTDQRRAGLFRKRQSHEFMVYRRALLGHTPAAGKSTSRIISRAQAPNSKELKTRINTILQDESKSAAAVGNGSKRSSFEVVKSHLTT